MKTIDELENKKNIKFQKVPKQIDGNHSEK